MKLASSNVFDVFLTLHDRLQLAILPEDTNGEENGGIFGLRSIIGPTRRYKNFKDDEPYCCNFFIIGPDIAKMSIAYSNPEKLIEFFSELHPDD